VVNPNLSIEARGESVEAAIEVGLSELGLGRDQVSIEVIQEESRGVLGIGARDALVRLTSTGAQDASEPEVASEPESVLSGDLEPETELETDSEVESDPTQSSEEEILALGRDILAELLEKMQISAEIHPRISKPHYAGDSSSLVLDLRGDDLGFLIGRKGETLAAIQHLVRLMVNKVVQQRVHLLVDVEGYKVRREDALKKLALRIADQATRRRRTVALEPMNAYERRIIHITLRNHPTVLTESVGEGSRRKVTIVPRP
jgi:spoIIIJ-associated protein